MYAIRVGNLSVCEVENERRLSKTGGGSGWKIVLRCCLENTGLGQQVEAGDGAEQWDGVRKLSLWDVA